jgi:hypothetical protein
VEEMCGRHFAKISTEAIHIQICKRGNLQGDWGCQIILLQVHTSYYKFVLNFGNILKGGGFDIIYGVDVLILADVTIRSKVSRGDDVKTC